MPSLRLPPSVPGLKSTSATVRRWNKSPGETFAKGDLLVELDTEDSLLHLEAAEAGSIGRILTEVGKTVPLGAELAELSAGPVTTRPSTAPKAPASPAPQVARKAPVSNSQPSGAVVPILMPQAGNTMEEGRLISWKAKVGDRIAAGQILCEIETDKATIEFESPEAGRLARIVAVEGAVVPVKQPIAYFAESDADIDLVLTHSAGNVAESSPPPSPAPSPAPVVHPAPGATKPPAGNVIPVLMPQAGNSMEEGTVIKWNVNVGDRISVGQIIYEIDTDKASVEVESTEAGRLARIVAQAGAVVPVKQPVAFLAENDADVDAYLAATGGASAAPTQASSPTATSASAAAAPAIQQPAARSDGGRVKASPAARKIAAEKGLDLSTIPTGSGPGGRILSTDLTGATAVPARPAAAAIPATPGTVVRRPLSKMRRAIATNLQVSKQTVPHFYVKQTIAADPLFSFYKTHKPATGCTLNDVILLAVGKTVYDFPAFRSRIDGSEIVEQPASNIGLAVSVDDGLVVPVVTSVERHTLSSLPVEAKRIAEAARKGKLENVGKGVFTISNMGMLGVEEFSAIINPPESGILAISSVRESVIVKDGAMRPARVMTLTLSVDHRVVDGAMAAQFMVALKQRLENPDSLL